MPSALERAILNEPVAFSVPVLATAGSSFFSFSWTIETLINDKAIWNPNKKSWFCKESDSCSLVIVIRDKNDLSLKYSKQLATWNFVKDANILEVALISKWHLKSDSFMDVQR